MADPATLVPRTSGIVDPERMRGLPLSPVDGFVLSRVDGTSSAGELAETMGIALEDVVASLLKLEAMRLVVLPQQMQTQAKPLAQPRQEPPPRQETPRARAPTPEPVRQAPQASPPVPPAPPSAPAVTAPTTGIPFTPEENIDIEVDHQRQVFELFERLTNLDHYGLLGVPRTADKKAIKRAYFEHTGRFHPDRFFRKRLGSYKIKMEAIFGRMTEAHDTLTSDRRAEYDAYLASIAQSRGIEDLMADALAEVERAKRAALDVKLSSAPPPPSSRTDSQLPPSSRAASQPPPPSSIPAFDPPTSPNLAALLQDALESRDVGKAPGRSARITIPPTRSDAPSGQSRREAFARRLMGTGLRPAPVPKLQPATPSKPAEAVDALKRRYEDKVSAAKSSQARKYTQSGLEAKAKGDIVAAANALNVALTFDPDNEELKRTHAEVQRAADQLLADQYLKQAEYEEKSDKWAEAARSWARVARARETDARAHDRGAACLVKADGNLHEASALAQKAVSLAPKNAHYRVTLANVYLAAGLTKNAKRELEAAAQLAPQDEHIATLLKRIAKSA